MGDDVLRDGADEQSEGGIMESLKTAEKSTVKGCSMIRRTECRELRLKTAVMSVCERRIANNSRLTAQSAISNILHENMDEENFAEYWIGRRTIC